MMTGATAMADERVPRANRRLRKFSSTFGHNRLIGRHLLPLLEQFGLARYDTILDLACGESPFRSYFSNCGQYLRMDRAPIDPEVVAADMAAIPLPSASVDMVLLFQAITDVPEPSVVLAEIRRVLKPGGTLLICESMCYPEHDAPYDYYRLMPEGLKWLASHNGLEVTAIHPLGGLFTRFASLWNDGVMGGIGRHRALRPLAALGRAAGNGLFGLLDRIALHPRLASDYLAVLRIAPTADSRPAAHDLERT